MNIYVFERVCIGTSFVIDPIVSEIISYRLTQIDDPPFSLIVNGLMINIRASVRFELFECEGNEFLIKLLSNNTVRMEFVCFYLAALKNMSEITSTFFRRLCDYYCEK